MMHPQDMERSKATVERGGSLNHVQGRALIREVERLTRGLNIIIQAGALHGGAWCVAQALGHRDDLDFDEWPETGRPPINPK